MRVLDIDLDFFLSGTCELAEYGCRPSESEATPWSEADFRAFLEDRCGLSAARPIPGRIFETHDAALDLWREKCEKPFHVTHVDAHSDLGIGRPGPAYVLESVITRPPESRVDIAGQRSAKKLDEANYLLFAIAYRWIASLDNVRNPGSRPDMPAFCREGHIKLVSSAGRLIPSLDHNEPEIPFNVYRDHRDFRSDAPYDLASLAISPRYSPASADRLAEIFGEYIYPV